MKYRRITILIICFIVTQSPFLSGYAQDGIDIANWYSLKVAEVDSAALHNHIHTMSVSVKDTGGKNTVLKQLYDKKGYLVRRVDYSPKNKLDSIETVIKRITPNELLVEYKFIRGDYYFEDEGNPASALLEYFDTLAAGSYSVLIKKYKRTSDSTVSVMTSIKGSVKKNAEFVLVNRANHQRVNAFGDTTYSQDTLVVTNQNKDANGNFSVLKTCYINGIESPVKIETLRYSHDVLLYQQVEINEFDKKNRLVNHAVYQGSPLRQYVSKKTTYNDLTGERTETEDNNPTTGSPQRIWRYNKKGNIIYFERVALTGRDKGSINYKYNKKGLLEELVFSVNDMPAKYTLYEYKYY